MGARRGVIPIGLTKESLLDLAVTELLGLLPSQPGLLGTSDAVADRREVGGRFVAGTAGYMAPLLLSPTADAISRHAPTALTAGPA